MSDDAPVSEDDEGELNEVDPELIETIEEIDSDLIKLQEETNNLLKDLCDKKSDKNLEDSRNAMPSEDLEKLKASFMRKRG